MIAKSPIRKALTAIIFLLPALTTGIPAPARSNLPASQSRIIIGEEIKGKEIIVMKGDIIHNFALQNELTSNLVLVKDQAEALRLLASGKHDYITFNLESSCKS